MPVTIGGGLSFCGRELTPQELDLFRQVTREFCALSLTELAHTRLRVTRVAPPQRIAEVPGVLSVPAGLA
jgi:hypothetical protein